MKITKELLETMIREQVTEADIIDFAAEKARRAEFDAMDALRAKLEDPNLSRFQRRAYQATLDTLEAEAAEEAVRVQAAMRAAEIKEQERQALDKLRSEHIIYFGFDVSNVSGRSALAVGYSNPGIEEAKKEYKIFVKENLASFI